MLPAGVFSLLISGKNLEHILFKCALHYAEQGLRVWFIAPKSFTEIPSEITIPGKDVLKLITFLYLEDHKDLVQHLNEIHTWYLVPNVIILNSYEHYCSLTSSPEELKIAFITSLLLDAANTCSKKHSKSAILLVGLDKISFNVSDRLNTLLHLYYRHIMDLKDVEEKQVVNSIISLASAM